MKAVERQKRSECSEDAMMSAGQKNTEETARNGIIEEKEEKQMKERLDILIVNKPHPERRQRPSSCQESFM